MKIAFLWLNFIMVVVGAQNQQLSNLPDAPPKPGRFPLTDRVWSTNAGDASVCMWADDKLATVSLTVDDNCYGNVAWWIETAEKHDFKVTWFLITDRISKGENPSFNGTWAQWRDVKALGHDLQSHTVWHLHTELPEWTNIDDEYRISQLQIEANIPGHKCEFLGFPGGANKGLNSRTNAATYYAAVRGGGTGISSPYMIDYLDIKTMSGFATTNFAAPYANLPSVLNSADSRYYRGWAVLLWHQISDYSALTPLLEFLDANRADLWIGLWGDVAKYGQERDTATLKVNEKTSERITLTLTDRMLDSRFNYPLTIKVCLPATWLNVLATQNGTSIESSVIEHNGVRYALVKAAPDCGEIALLPAAAN